MDNKEEVLRLLAEVEIQATRLRALGSDVVRDSQFSEDIVKAIREVVSQRGADLTPEYWNHLRDTLRAWKISAEELEKFRPVVAAFGAQSLSVASTSSTVMWSMTAAGFPTVGAQGPTRQLAQVMNRASLVDDARAALRRLGLDKREGSSRSALDLLEDAKAGLDRPSSPEGSPLAVLLAIRECINRALAELVRRRPKQEPTGKPSQKLTSIGRQCGRRGLDEGHFFRLAYNTDILVNVLAGAKQGEMPRERVSELFNQGVTQLSAILDSIDETRLRP